MSKSAFELAVDELDGLCKQGDLVAIRKIDIAATDLDLLPYIDVAYRGALEKLAGEGKFDLIMSFGNIHTYLALRAPAKTKLIEVLGRYENSYLSLHSYLNNEPIPAILSLIEDELMKSFDFVYALPSRGRELFVESFLKTTHSDRVRMAAIEFLASKGQLEPIQHLLTPDKETVQVSDRVKAYAEGMLATKGVQLGINVGKEMARRGAPLAKVPQTHLGKAKN